MIILKIALIWSIAFTLISCAMNGERAEPPQDYVPINSNEYRIA